MLSRVISKWRKRAWSMLTRVTMRLWDNFWLYTYTHTHAHTHTHTHTHTHIYILQKVTCGKISQKVFDINTLRPRQNGRHFADDIFRCIFLNENVWIPMKNSLKFVPKGPINNIPALVQIMAWRRPGDKPLSEPMMVRLLTHICVTRPQRVNNGLKYDGPLFPRKIS